MLILTLFPNMKGARLKFGCHLARWQWEYWTTWQLTPTSSPHISSHVLHLDWARRYIKAPFPFFSSLPRPEAPTYAVLGLSWTGSHSGSLVERPPWATLWGRVAGALVYKKEAVHYMRRNHILAATRVIWKDDQSSGVSWLPWELEIWASGNSNDNIYGVFPQQCW